MDVKQLVTCVEEENREKKEKNEWNRKKEKNKNKISKQKVCAEHDEREGTWNKRIISRSEVRLDSGNGEYRNRVKYLMAIK